MTQAEIIQVLSGLAGATGFAVLFNIRGKRLVATAIGGMLSWLLFVLISKGVENDAVVYFMVACAISIYAEIMARALKTPTTTFIITSLIPLIPGGSLYYTMTSVFQAGQEVFTEKAVYTLQLAAALALGIVTVTAFSRLLHRVIQCLVRERAV